MAYYIPLTWKTGGHVPRVPKLRPWLLL